MRSYDDIAAEIRDGKPVMASTVIEQLTKLVRTHGDLPVILADRDVTLREIKAYDADGDTVGTPVEIGLHGW